MSATRESTEAAEQLAIEALAYIAGDPTLMSRFLALTGIEAASIRQAAAQPGFLAGVLHFIAAHEPTLLAFADARSIPPGDVLKAMRALPLGEDAHERST
ncbi:MAG: DUF3572 domain-containing protein [Rhizobiaceae bacterium]|nr:DUF3572 domain-containing protein [Rhizobiaceae bacterium]